jgi:hypothetical protein
VQHLVCNKYPLELNVDLEGDWTNFFQHFQSRSSKYNAYSFAELASILPKDLTVAEHFGGIGEFSTVIRNVIKPRTHWVNDLNPGCVRQLQTIPGLTVNHGSAKDTMKSVSAELVSLDFPYFTYKTWPEWPMSEMFKLNPRYVIWVDCAKHRYAVHRAMYTALTGTNITDYFSYLRAVNRRVEECGYHITQLANKHFYVYMLAEPLEHGSLAPELV